MKTFPTAHNANQQLLCMEIDEFVKAFGGDTTEPKDDHLKRVLIRAKWIAYGYAAEEDGGTSNFDSPLIDYQAYGIPLKRMEQIVQDAGLTCYTTKMFRRKVMIICGFLSGQGNRRTKMAEAFAAALDAAGIPSGVYYAMD